VATLQQSPASLAEQPTPSEGIEGSPAEFMPGIGNWQSWAMGAAGAFFGAPYLEADSAHAAWAGLMQALRIRLTR